jgi:alanine-glyoxylate transaminase / serine-glyoxylate transaminase / serine-pyruvate transaminase
MGSFALHTPRSSYLAGDYHMVSGERLGYTHPATTKKAAMHPFLPPTRLLLGPGPSMVHPRVLQAMAAPLVGHLDPAFLSIMNDIQAGLRQVFATKNSLTLALSGTGSAGMEAAIVNVIEPGDTIIVGVNGVFGTRLATVAERCGAKAIQVDAPWGQVIEANAIEAALQRSGPVKAVAIVHAETSTGAWQPLEAIGRLCQAHNALFIVDAVTSLAGVPVEVDRWGIDVCYSGTQKCLSCPPGLAPITLSDRALTAIKQRRTPCQSWYLDLSLIAEYWADGSRAYHHTAPISMLYALREALRLVEEEGLPARFSRHQRNGQALVAGLITLGFQPVPLPDHRLPMLTCVTVPSHIDEAAVRTELLQAFGVEIGGGLGPLKGRVWRIGLMGESSTEAHVLTLLHALEEIGIRSGWLSSQGMALLEATRFLAAPRGVK